jgi:NAD+ synthase (glutamine-hydrolysing)
LVLTTGNKSEVAVGYSTMYGDTVGGFAPLKDVPKTLVWALAERRNDRARRAGEVPPIPANSISKPPSAELRPDQTDQDSLPDYETLDAILERLIDERRTVAEIVTDGYDAETVKRVAHMVRISEWKRRQGAIGPRISAMAFGRERRLPITVRRTTL